MNVRGKLGRYSIINRRRYSESRISSAGSLGRDGWPVGQSSIQTSGP